MIEVSQAGFRKVSTEDFPSSNLKVCKQVRLVMSQTRMLLSSLLLKISSCLLMTKSKDGNFGKSSPGVKDGTANIVVVAPACIHLPSLVGERRSLAIMVVFCAYIFQTITIVLIIDTIKRLFCSNHIGSY